MTIKIGHPNPLPQYSTGLKIDSGANYRYAARVKTGLAEVITGA